MFSSNILLILSVSVYVSTVLLLWPLRWQSLYRRQATGPVLDVLPPSFLPSSPSFVSFSFKPIQPSEHVLDTWIRPRPTTRAVQAGKFACRTWKNTTRGNVGKLPVHLAHTKQSTLAVHCGPFVLEPVLYNSDRRTSTPNITVDNHST